MKFIIDLAAPRGLRVSMALAALAIVFAAGSVSAKTPDGKPPSEETVCSGLSGAAFGLCNAYCEAHDCDVHPRPSCAVLRRLFEKVTGNPVLPCDQRCGNGRTEGGEECDPPGSECTGGGFCNLECTCAGCTPTPVCGDGIVGPGEQCDPPNTACSGGFCTADCACMPTECGNGMVEPGEQCDPPGSLCSGGQCSFGCVCIPIP